MEYRRRHCSILRAKWQLGDGVQVRREKQKYEMVSLLDGKEIVA
jgi:hypothetical protein